MSEKTYWVYMLLCSNNTYYTGYTSDLEKRFNSHINGTASKYTRSFKPISLAQFWHFGENKALAMRVERLIKKMSRRQKEKIIADSALLQPTIDR